MKVIFSQGPKVDYGHPCGAIFLPSTAFFPDSAQLLIDRPGIGREQGISRVWVL
jgi:hypothetical protein